MEISEKNYISQIEPIKTFFGSGNIDKTPPISVGKVKQALRKLFMSENKKEWEKMGFPNETFFESMNSPNIEILPNNIAEFKEEGKECIRIAYRTYRGKKKNDNPFFSISDRQIEKLKRKGVNYEALLFWEKQESGNSAPTYIYVFALDEIKDKWEIQSNTKNKNPLYRISFRYKNDERYVYNLSTSEETIQLTIQLYKFMTGTTMSVDA